MKDMGDCNKFCLAWSLRVDCSNCYLIDTSWSHLSRTIMRIKKRTRSTYQPLLSLGHILCNLPIDQYLIPVKHQLLSFSRTSHSHGVIALWQQGIPVEAECVPHSGNPKTRWVRTWRSRICAAFLNMSHEEEIV